MLMSMTAVRDAVEDLAPRRGDRPTVLICEDATLELGRYFSFAERLGFSPVATSRAVDAIALLAARPFRYLLTDVNLSHAPDGAEEGLSLIAHAARFSPETIVVAMSALPDLALAGRTLERGAAHFVRKPLLHADDLGVALRLARERTLLLRALKDARRIRLPQEGGRAGDQSRAVILDASQRHALEECLRLARAPVFLHGEMGTGKDTFSLVLADALRSRGAGLGPTVRVGSTPLPDAEWAEILLGRRRRDDAGGWTATTGLLEKARGGLLVLDEPGRLSLSQQEILLRPLAEGRYARLGEEEESAVEVQVVSLNADDPDKLVAKRRLLPELAALLAGVEVRVPPLRERFDELPLFVGAHFEALGIGMGLDVSRALCERLAGFHWQGNLRQLFRVLDVLVELDPDEADPRRRFAPERVPVFRSMLAPGVAPETRFGNDPALDVGGLTVGAPTATASAGGVSASPPTATERKALQAFLAALREDAPYARTLDLLEEAVLGAALARHGGNVASVARSLRLARSSLDAKRKRLGFNG